MLKGTAHDGTAPGGGPAAQGGDFTDWDPTAASDLEALRSVFDTNGDGVLNASDSTWSQFRVAVTEPDGTLSYHTLAELGITEIDLMGDATHIELPDGSVITGQTTFTMNGQTRTIN
jgi:hypothetical protein